MGQAERSDEEWRLLKAVAEQLKLPLMQLARGAELNVWTEQTVPWHDIQLSADAALKMVDSYLIGLELVENQLSLLLEPVSVPMILSEVAHELSPFARQYNVELEVSAVGKMVPVMAHPQTLRTALLSLGQTLVSSAPAANKRSFLKLIARRQSGSVATGLFGEFDLSAPALKRARQLYGRAAQPLAALSSGAAGIFVADALLEAMAAPLRARRYQHLSGLAVNLPLSRQLELV